MDDAATDLSFGSFRFEPATGAAVERATARSSSRAKPRAVLGRARRARRPAGHQGGLFAAVWSDTVVSDDALTTCIQELRKALGDDAKQPRFIETRHRRGYRFVAELSH